jgi:hypothetical protein
MIWLFVAILSLWFTYKMITMKDPNREEFNEACEYLFGKRADQITMSEFYPIVIEMAQKKKEMEKSND